MASISFSISASCFVRPQAQARSRTQRQSSRRNPNPKFKPKKPVKYKRLSYSAPSPADEATTYTRLPPREDFSVPFSKNSREIKLGDSDFVKIDSNSSQRGVVNSVEEEDEEEIELFDGNFEGEEEEDEEEGDEDYYDEFDGEIPDFSDEGEFKVKEKGGSSYNAMF